MFENDHQRMSTAGTLRDDERTPCEVWTRVMGYHRPIASFNKGKRSEFFERKAFREEVAHLD